MFENTEFNITEWLIVYPHLKRVPILSLVDRSQDGLVDPEAHGGSDEGQGEVANHTATYQEDDVCSCWLIKVKDWPDEGDVSHRQEAHQDGAADDAGVPGVVPVQERVPLSWAEPHLAELYLSLQRLSSRERRSLVLILTFRTGRGWPLATELQLFGENSGLATYLARYRAALIAEDWTGLVR